MPHFIFECPFCDQNRETWEYLQFHIGAWHTPIIVEQEQKELRDAALLEIMSEKNDPFSIMVLTSEWIEVVRANRN